MSQKEIDAMNVPIEIEKKILWAWEWATKLWITQRQMIRIKKEYQKSWEGWIIHKLRGRRSNRSMDERIKKTIRIALTEWVYAWFWPMYLQEEVCESRMEIQVSKETSRKLMIEWRMRIPRYDTTAVSWWCHFSSNACNFCKEWKKCVFEFREECFHWLMSFREQRVVKNDYTIQYNNQIIQLEDVGDKTRPKLGVFIYERYDTWKLRITNKSWKIILYKKVKQRPVYIDPVKEEQEKKTNEKKAKEWKKREEKRYGESKKRQRTLRILPLVFFQKLSKSHPDLSKRELLKMAKNLHQRAWLEDERTAWRATPKKTLVQLHSFIFYEANVIFLFCPT